MSSISFIVFIAFSPGSECKVSALVFSVEKSLGAVSAESSSAVRALSPESNGVLSTTLNSESASDETVRGGFFTQTP